MNIPNYFTHLMRNPNQFEFLRLIKNFLRNINVYTNNLHSEKTTIKVLLGFKN